MIKTESLRKVIQKSITQNINLGGIKTHVTAEIDGKVVLDEDGHSIVGNFVNWLYPWMSNLASATNVRQTTLAPYAFTVQDSGGKLRINMVSAYAVAGTDILYIQTFDGTPSLAGTHLSVTGMPSAYSYLTTTDWNAAWSGRSGTFRSINLSEPVKGVYGNRQALNPVLQVGKGSTAVSIDDYDMETVGLTESTQLIATVTADAGKDTAYLAFTRSYTNATAADIDINEIGLYLRTYYNTALTGQGTYTLCARDVFSSTITVPAAGTVILKYTLSTAITGGGGTSNQGGFVVAFLQFISNMLQAGTQAVTIATSESVTPTNGNNATVLNIYSMGRKTAVGYNANTALWRIGIQCGTSDQQTVDITNYDLNTPIDDGETSGTLRYWGSWMDDVATGAGYRQIAIHRLVENVSGADITVGEIGLFASAAIVPYNYNIGGTPAMIAKTVFQESEQFTIPDGYYCEITYIIKVEV